MARFFKPKRRRVNNGPNKNEQKVLRRERDSRVEGALRDRFPGVESLSLDLEFVTPQGDPFEDAERRMSAGDPVDLTASCPGRCGNGKFDLSDRLRELTRERRETAEEHLVCRETVYGDPGKTCDFRLTCRIELRYTPS